MLWLGGPSADCSYLRPALRLQHPDPPTLTAIGMDRTLFKIVLQASRFISRIPIAIALTQPQSSLLTQQRGLTLLLANGVFRQSFTAISGASAVLPNPSMSAADSD